MDFERELAKHKDDVYRQMLRVCGNADDAEDALATAIIKAYRASGQLEDPGSFRPWLTTIGRRACIRLRQKSGKNVSLEALQEAGVPIPDLSAPTAEENLELERTKQCALQAFEGLPEQFKELYRLREIDGLTNEQTAHKLGLTIANVKTRLHRARVLVREALDTAFED